MKRHQSISDPSTHEFANRFKSLSVALLVVTVCLFHLGCSGEMGPPASETAQFENKETADATPSPDVDESRFEGAKNESETMSSDDYAGGYGGAKPAEHDGPAAGDKYDDEESSSSMGDREAPRPVAQMNKRTAEDSAIPKDGDSKDTDALSTAPLAMPPDQSVAQGERVDENMIRPGKSGSSEVGNKRANGQKEADAKTDMPLATTEADEEAPEPANTPDAPAPGAMAEGQHPGGGFFEEGRTGGDGKPAAFGSRQLTFGISKEAKRTMQFDLQPGEELWVIARSAEPGDVRPDDVPGSGSLIATLPEQTQTIPIPLKHTAVEGNIDGYVATVDVKQEFHNPYDSKIEASYVFPLPQNAAVNEFVMTVGDRKIRGIIREREKAEQIYAAARSQGHVAAMMSQERPNVFTQKVANIEPGKKIDINIRYFNTLRYDDGAYEFVFPMVVGPRFNPPTSADGVGAVARGDYGGSGQKTEVQYLAPDERSGHDVSLSLNINAGLSIEDVHCVNHAVKVKANGESGRKITLSKKDRIPNKDFVLRYKVAGDQIKTAMLTREDDNGKYFILMLHPPADLSAVQRSPMEMVFVLDCSGSMKGKPLAQAKAAISHALQSLTPRDSFQIIRFSNNASQLGAEPVLATEANVQRGLQFLTSLNGGGGTHMIEGIKAALSFPHDEGRFRLVSFMTDGFIGNEQQILGTLHDQLGASRIFSFGVGSSPNRFLMDRMAVLGRGAVAYLSLNDDAVDVMDRFNDQISHPAMTDLAIDWGQMRVTDVYPQRLPDLIVGRPVVLTGRFKGEPDTVKVNGRVDMQPASFSVSLNDESVESQHSGIAAVWARLKIKDMMNYAAHAPDAADEIKQSVTETALAYNLMSSYTSFVAVDSLSKTEGTFGTTVAVPVPVPEGVRYDTTVPGNSN